MLVALLVTLAGLAGISGSGGAPSAAGFSPAVKSDVARRALTLMPPALQRIVERHRAELEAGLSTPAGSPPAEALAPAIEQVVASLNRRAPMAEVVRHLGRLAAVSADLAWALEARDADPRTGKIAADFRRYVENRLDRMAVTFDGFADPALAQADLPGFARAVSARAARDLPSILLSYFPEGRARLPEDFDERSLAFGAASLEVSLALTATARTWLFAWQKAGGDLTGTWSAVPLSRDNPFASQPTPERPAPAGRERSR